MKKRKKLPKLPPAPRLSRDWIDDPSELALGLKAMSTLMPFIMEHPKATAKEKKAAEALKPFFAYFLDRADEIKNGSLSLDQLVRDFLYLQALN